MPFFLRPFEFGPVSLPTVMHAAADVARASLARSAERTHRRAACASRSDSAFRRSCDASRSAILGVIGGAGPTPCQILARWRGWGGEATLICEIGPACAGKRNRSPFPSLHFVDSPPHARGRGEILQSRRTLGAVATGYARLGEAAGHPAGLGLPPVRRTASAWRRVPSPPWNADRPAPPRPRASPSAAPTTGSRRSRSPRR